MRQIKHLSLLTYLHKCKRCVKHVKQKTSKRSRDFYFSTSYGDTRTYWTFYLVDTAQKMKFSIKDFFGKCSGGSRTAATSKMERFVVIVNGWKPLTIITKCSILDVAAALDLPLCDQIRSFLRI